MRVPLCVASLAFCAAALLNRQPLRAQSAQDHQYSTADIEAGARLYSAQCTLCHGPNGEQVAGINLQRGQFRRASSDDDLRQVILNGVPGTGMPPFKFQKNEVDAVIAFIRAGFDPGGTAVRVGNAQRGEALFSGKGQCATCHRVNGKGPRTAPDLSDVGAIRTPAALHRTLIDPTSGMFPIDRPVRIVLRDGRIFSGRRLNEDTYTVQLIDERERLVSIDKAQVQDFWLGLESPMPPATKVLNGEEIADVVAYLLTLKGL